MPMIQELRLIRPPVVYTCREPRWSPVMETTIPNDNSNLNAGVLPGGKGVFLLSNAAPAKVRDPLTVRTEPLYPPAHAAGHFRGRHYPTIAGGPERS